MARPKGSKNAVRTKKANIDYVTAVVVPVGLHKFSGHIRQLLAKTFAVIRNSAQCSHCREKLFAVLQASARYSSVLFGI